MTSYRKVRKMTSSMFLSTVEQWKIQKYEIIYTGTEMGSNSSYLYNYFYLKYCRLVPKTVLVDEPWHVSDLTLEVLAMD